MDNSKEIADICSDLVRGDYSVDECFCMILSLIGYDSCRSNFRTYVSAVRSRNPCLHNQLVNVYKAYFDAAESERRFNLPDKVDCAVENGFYSNDSNANDDASFMLDLELAMKLSMQEANTTGQLGNTYAKAARGHQTNSNKTDYSQVNSTLLSDADNPVRTAQRESPHVDCLPSRAIVSSTPFQEDAKTRNSNKRRRKKHKKKNDIEHPLSNAPVICWFRRDLRLYDNPALVAASNTGAPVIPLFMWSDREEECEQVYATGGASKYWLHMALPTLSSDMVDKYNNPMIFRKSDNYLKELLDIVKVSGARTLIINDLYEPHLKERDDKICKTLQAKGVKCERYHSYLLHEPGSIKTESCCMRGIGSVTHFMECCRQSSMEPLRLPLEPPGCLPTTGMRPKTDLLDDLGLGKLPRRKDGTVVSIC